ncbi:MAG: hypothetical protein ACJ8EO_12250, partial [Sphingomicrobium sp.]
MSFAIFISEHATVLSAPDAWTSASWAASASNLFGAVEQALREAYQADRKEDDRADHVRADQRLEHIQFEMAQQSADGDRDV